MITKSAYLNAIYKRLRPRTGFWARSVLMTCLVPALLSACGGGGGGVLSPSSEVSDHLKQSFTGTYTLFNTDDQEFKNISTSGAQHPFNLTNVVNAYQKGLSGNGQSIVIVDSYFDASASYTNSNLALRAFPELQAKFNDTTAGGVRWNLNNPIEQGSVAELPHGNIVASIAAAPYNKNVGAEFYCSVSTESASQNNCYPENNIKPELNHGMHGVAFNAGLYLIDYEPSNFSLNSLASDISAATSSSSKVMNNSWGISLAQGSYRNNNVATVGSNTPEGMSIDQAAEWLVDRTRLTSASWKTYLSALESFQENGVIVFALQNDASATSASVTAALPEVYPNLKGAWIAAGNIETSNQQQQLVVTRRAASCKETAEYCLVADGTALRGAGYRNVPGGANSQNGLYRDVNTDGSALSGTSLAAPQISGMIALLAEAFPNHTPKQLTSRLLASANNRFLINTNEPVTNTGTTNFGNGVSHAYSEEFGHGIPDMAAALSPIGTTVIPTTAATLAAASTTPVAQTFIAPSSAFGDGIERSLRGLSLTIYDGLYGGFALPVESLTRVKRTSKGLKLTPRLADADTSDATVNLLGGPSVKLGLSVNKSLRQSISANTLAQGHFSDASYTSPARFNRLSHELPFIDDHQDMRLDFFSHGFSIGGFFKKNDTKAPNGRSHFTQGVSGYKDLINTEGFNLSLAAGYQLEQESFRNGLAGGALSLGPATSSWFLAPNFQVTNKRVYFEATAALSVSSTSLQSGEQSLVRGFSPYTTSGWRMSTGTRDLWVARDHLYARIWQPERVESGFIEIALPSLVGIDEQLSFSHHRVSFKPSGREVNLSLGYAHPIGRTITVAMEASLSKDSGHIRADALRSSLLTSLQVAF